MGIIDKSLKLNNRERMLRVCQNKDVDRLPLWFMFGPWEETLVRWNKEGLSTEDWREYFGLDVGFEALPVNLGFCPEFPHIVLSEDERTRTVVNHLGITLVESKVGATIPLFTNYPIKNRKDWEKIKTERLNPYSPERFPDNWGKLIQDMKERDAAIQIGIFPYGLFGTLRDFMGVEELLVTFYDDPDLIHEMMDYLTDFWLKIYEQVLSDVQIDHIHLWEDMSGKNGPLISPTMFREFITPNYKKIVAFAKQKNIPIVSVDTDGNMDILMPLLEESGINFVLPFEVQAGCDVVKLRNQFPNIAMHGGIDKRNIALTLSDIDKELDRLEELFKKSGYIPSLDHLAHPEISLDNFTYFVKKLKEKIGY
jgi:uroporphyrinogen decarboxylase